MKKSDNFRLAWVFALLFAAVAAIPVAIFAGTYFGFTSPAVTKSVERRQVDQATLLGAMFDEYFGFLATSLRVDAERTGKPLQLSGDLPARAETTASSRPEVTRMALLPSAALGTEESATNVFGKLPASVAAQIAQAIQSRQALWSMQFLSPRTGKRSIARIQPAGDALILAEVSLDRLEGSLAKVSAAASYRVLIVDGAGNIVMASGDTPSANPANPANPANSASSARTTPAESVDFSNVIGEPNSNAANAAAAKVLSGRFLLDGEAYIGRARTVGATGWRVIVAERASVIAMTFKLTVSVIVAALLASILAAVLVGMWLSRRAMRRVDQVIGFADQLARGDTTPWQASRIREINLLGSYVQRLANESKRRTDAQLEASALFSSTFRYSPVATSLRRYPTLELVDVNESWERMFETSRAAALAGGASPFQILTPSDAYTFVNAEMAANRIVIDLPITVRISSGKQLSVLVSCVRVIANQTECQLTTTFDITDRVQAEASLRESEARFSAIVATMAEGVVVVQNQGASVASCNQAAENILGISEAQLRGDVPRDPTWQIISADGKTLARHEWPATIAIQSGKPLIGQHLVVIRPDGTKRDITVNAMPLESPSLGGRGALVTISDRTAEYEALNALQTLAVTLEDKVAQRTTALEDANAELKTFSYSVSHDLRSPLRAIDGFAQLLNERHGHELSPEAKRHLDRVLQSAKRMNGIIDDLLMLARVTQAEVNFSAVNVSEIATSVAEQLSANSPRQVEWTIESGIEVDSDAGLMRVVLENLLGNAWKYSSKTEVARIALRANKGVPEHYIGFVVEDNGAGFDQQYADRLFAPFRRLHAESEFPGSGIGLATVRRAVTRLGGAVRAEGVVNGGAKFWVTLPRHWRES